MNNTLFLLFLPSSFAIAASARTVFPLAVGAETTTFSDVFNITGTAIDCILLKYLKGNNPVNFLSIVPSTGKSSFCVSHIASI
jgi:hypothetical protein